MLYPIIANPVFQSQCHIYKYFIISYLIVCPSVLIVRFRYGWCTLMYGGLQLLLFPYIDVLHILFTRIPLIDLKFINAFYQWEHFGISIIS